MIGQLFLLNLILATEYAIYGIEVSCHGDFFNNGNCINEIHTLILDTDKEFTKVLVLCTNLFFFKPKCKFGTNASIDVIHDLVILTHNQTTVVRFAGSSNDW